MKNTNSILCFLIMMSVGACSSGAAYIPTPDVNTTQQPLTPTSAGDANHTTDANTPNTNLGQTPLQAPSFQPTIDGDVFTPRTVFYASGQDPQNHPVLMLVVSDQNDLCTQLTTTKQLMPGSSQLAIYIYSVQADGTSSTIVAPPTTAGTYAVFDSAAPSADVSVNPSLDLPTDGGGYASGEFSMFDPLCAKIHRHQLSEGAIDITGVDTAGDKASGAIQVMLDNRVSLDTGGTFVAQACPALLQQPADPAGCALAP